MLRWMWVSVAVIVVDQLTKLLAASQLELHRPVELLPMFNFTLMYNTGAAFSFLSSAGGWQRWFFALVAIIVSFAIVMWLRRLTHERLQAISLALILGGALGNLIDRLFYGHVIDFIDVYYRADSCLPMFYSWSRTGQVECHWPAFNIADSAISVGVVLILFDTIYQHFADRKLAAKHSD